MRPSAWLSSCGRPGLNSQAWTARSRWKCGAPRWTTTARWSGRSRSRRTTPTTPTRAPPAA
eukprot:12580045-Alexandrium_andersonii.AAC.1